MNALGPAQPNETLACVIIDDPLLRPRYGCLDYKVLLEEMKSHNFFTEIAFIPWNYRRSESKTIRLFLDNSDHYAICVHGCNHTRNEFGRGSCKKLNALSSTALWRMEEHRKLTGLPYDRVMVFPQGRFSSVAMQSLKNQGYLAAFNSTIRATDGEELPPIEYTKPATTVYHDLPLFLRRYPRDRIRFIQDIASGRPIVVVEHHGAFRNGYRTITELVDWINSLGNVKWCSLSEIAKRYSGTMTADIFTCSGQSSGDPHSSSTVALRRYLSEARDNYIETSNLMTKLYMKIRCHL